MSRGGQSLLACDVLYGELLPAASSRETLGLPGSILSAVDIDLNHLNIRARSIQGYRCDGNPYSGGITWLALIDELPEEWNAGKHQLGTVVTNFLDNITAKGWEQLESEQFDPILNPGNSASVIVRPWHDVSNPMYFNTNQMAAVEQLTNGIRNEEWGWAYLAEPERDLGTSAGKHYAVLLDTEADGNKRILGVVCA